LGRRGYQPRRQPLAGGQHGDPIIKIDYHAALCHLRTQSISACSEEPRRWLRFPYGSVDIIFGSGGSGVRVQIAHHCNIIEAPWLVNGAHGASLRRHKGLLSPGSPKALAAWRRHCSRAVSTTVRIKDRLGRDVRKLVNLSHRHGSSHDDSMLPHSGRKHLGESQSPPRFRL
jgi:hypothetical protein